jgi:pimeloyl-ACP methyl ester carboxylesterase
MTNATAEKTTHTLEVPGASLIYDIQRNESSAEPPLFLIGSPMGAAGFASLAGHFPDRTIVTYDNRGSDRSTAHEPAAPITPDVHREDLHAIVDAIGGGPVDVFASSGGAVNALAWVARYPNDIRTLVAHEPPLASLVPDREHAMTATRAINATYQRAGFGAGMAHFIQIVSHRGPFTAEIAAAPGPDPQMFGMPAEDDGKRTDLMLGHSVLYLTSYEPDFDALRRAPTRIVVGVGAKSDGEMAQRGGAAVAERLGVETTAFPGDHGGFLGGEYGQVGEPEAFAAKLREVLSAG